MNINRQVNKKPLNSISDIYQDLFPRKPSPSNCSKETDSIDNPQDKGFPRNRDLTTSIVATKAGINDPGNFERLFRQDTGILVKGDKDPNSGPKVKALQQREEVVSICCGNLK